MTSRCPAPPGCGWPTPLPPTLIQSGVLLPSAAIHDHRAEVLLLALIEQSHREACAQHEDGIWEAQGVERWYRVNRIYWTVLKAAGHSTFLEDQQDRHNGPANAHMLFIGLVDQ